MHREGDEGDNDEEEDIEVDEGLRNEDRQEDSCRKTWMIGIRGMEGRKRMKRSKNIGMSRKDS